MTEAEWNALLDYTAHTNVKIVGRYASTDAPPDTGAQIMIYQYDGTAFLETGYFENAESSQTYLGKDQYYVKDGDNYAYIQYVEYSDFAGWQKNPEITKTEYDGAINGGSTSDPPVRWENLDFPTSPMTQKPAHI